MVIVGPYKNRVTWGGMGGTIFFARKGKPEKGDCHFLLLYSSVTFTFTYNHIYCVRGENKVHFITFQIVSLLSYPCKIFIHLLIQVLY